MPTAPSTPAELLSAFDVVRRQTLALCEPLTPEDMGVQSMAQASPTKWHLAHTTWFFETFLLSERPGYVPFHPRFRYLFNSYYDAIGDRFARASRGVLSRPGLDEILAYRDHVDSAMRHVLDEDRLSPQTCERMVLGLHHEQQHQELILTDILHAFSRNPLYPAYRPPPAFAASASAPRWFDHPGGLVSIGHQGPGFAFDNESPRHQVFLVPYRLASRLVDCGAYREFIADGGYQRPELWVSDGWHTCRTEGWQAPLYWERSGSQWMQFTLHGLVPVRDAEPVVHVSWYEADAFARWAKARLPTEAEWEHAVERIPLTGSFLESGRFHPQGAAEASAHPVQVFGELWQWTASPYIGYPGYRPVEGALGEYNAKFTCNQFVLRGGSCLTPRSHLRRSYRNFFPPEARWQFSGIRLARDGD